MIVLKINNKEKILKVARGGNLAYKGNTISYEHISQETTNQKIMEWHNECVEQ